MVIYSSPYDVGDRVHIDDDDAITARVLGLTFRDRHGPAQLIECGWMHNGTAMSAWLPPLRLTHADPAKRSAADDDLSPF